MTALVLPEPFASAPASAHTEYGKRVVTWTLSDPGEIARNGYQIAWVDITEREPWKGEPLWVSATRRQELCIFGRRLTFTEGGTDRWANITCLGGCESLPTT